MENWAESLLSQPEPSHFLSPSISLDVASDTSATAATTATTANADTTTQTGSDLESSAHFTSVGLYFGIDPEAGTGADSEGPLPGRGCDVAESLPVGELAGVEGCGGTC